MTLIPYVAFTDCERGIANNEVDQDLPGALGYVVTPMVRWQDNQQIDLTSPLPLLGPGHQYTTIYQIQDTQASGLQARFGFHVWQRTRTIVKVSEDQLQVTDQVYWPSSGSTAQRTYQVTATGGGVDLALRPWAINIHNVPVAGVIAGQMRSRMDATDAGYASRLSARYGQAAA